MSAKEISICLAILAGGILVGVAFRGLTDAKAWTNPR